MQNDVRVSSRPERDEVLFSCPVCGLRDVIINVGEERPGTPLVDRLKSVSPLIAASHRRLSRRCPNDKMNVMLPSVPDDPMALTWSYGLTTVPSRIDTTLPTTLASLVAAGFPSPRLFVDNWDGQTLYKHLNLPVTYHQGTLQPFGNWYLALWELWIRDPKAQRYAIFQDDFITVRNLCKYLERTPYPQKGYLNLYTAFGRPENRTGGNERVVQGNPPGWYEGALVTERITNRDRLQAGLGAVALVFSNEAVQVLLSAPTLRDKPKAVDKLIKYRKVDGGVVTAMNLAGWREYVHNPSLVQHIGIISSCGNREHPQALTFPGEDFDALTLLERKG